MYGAIIGDLAGSIYEFDQLNGIKNIKINNLIEENSFFSDDTILTVAVLDAINNGSLDYDLYLRKYIEKYKNYKPSFSPYFKSSFSPGLIKWSRDNVVGVSKGNGCLMRVSPVGYMFNCEKDVISNATLATIPSHNTQESICSAITISLIIFYLRKGMSITDIYKKLNLDVRYVPFEKFNTTCKETIGNCLYALYNSTSFEDAISQTIMMGGDTDTNACIVGAMAEALYGIDSSLIDKAKEKIPKEFVKVIDRSGFY